MYSLNLSHKSPWINQKNNSGLVSLSRIRETFSIELKTVHFKEPIIRILADFDARMERNETVTSFLSCLLPENIENA